jgi:hypothetical protein
VPPEAAGYSGTALAKKLGIAEGTTLALVNAPTRWAIDLPPDVAVKRRVGGHVDVAVAFFTSAATLEKRVDALAAMIFPAGGLWIAWPKKTSGVATDLGDNVVRAAALARGLVDNKVCALDATWSALRLVWRRENRTAAGAHARKP